MRNCRDPYPFHRQPVVSIGYRPAPAALFKVKRRLLAGTAGYLFAVGVAASALLGFFTP